MSGMWGALRKIRPGAAQPSFRRRDAGLGRRCRLVLPAVLLVWMSAPAAAQAATVYSGVLYRAAPGEVNDVTVTFERLDQSFEGNGIFRVTDRGAPLTAGGDCASVDAHTASCPGNIHGRVEIDLGDRDDRA